jgi:hypothetical protein
MFEFSDIKYIRFETISIELPSKEVALIPPLNVFQEVAILELYKNITTFELIDKNTASNIHQIINIATDNKIDLNELSKEGTIFLFNQIFKFVILPVFEFFQDPKVIEFMKHNVRQAKEQGYNFNFLYTITYVMERLSIPDSYSKFLGIRFYLWASRQLRSNEAIDSINRININHSLGQWIALLTVPGRKKGMLKSPFESLLRNNYDILGQDFNAVKSKKDVIAMTEEAERKGEIMTQEEYAKKHYPQFLKYMKISEN